MLAFTSINQAFPWLCCIFFRTPAWMCFTYSLICIYTYSVIREEFLPFMLGWFITWSWSFLLCWLACARCGLCRDKGLCVFLHYNHPHLDFLVPGFPTRGPYSMACLILSQSPAVDIPTIFGTVLLSWMFSQILILSFSYFDFIWYILLVLLSVSCLWFSVLAWFGPCSN